MSSSVPARIDGSISTTSTAVPSALNSVANSIPITPPPIITTDFGHFVSSSTPSEFITPSFSTPGMGTLTGALPVARIMFFALYDLPSTSKAVEVTSLALPVTTSTLCPRKRPAIPRLNFATTSFFRSAILAKSKFTLSAVTPKPSLCNICSKSSALCKNAFVGIHPLLRHVPPKSLFSTRIVLLPSCDARIAAIYPPGPPPITATSQSNSESIEEGVVGEGTGLLTVSGTISSVFSPGCPTTAIVFVIGTTSPAPWIILRRVPLTSESMVMVSLSVSISKIGVPTEISSPCFTSQLSIVPSVI